MTSIPPKPETETGLRMPEPPAADYCDELTDAQFATLRDVWPQAEAAMGPVVHEFAW